MLLTPELYRKIRDRYTEGLSKIDRISAKELKQAGGFEVYLCDELARIEKLRRDIANKDKEIREYDKARENLVSELNKIYASCPHYMITVKRCYEDKSVTCELCGADLT